MKIIYHQEVLPFQLGALVTGIRREFFKGIRDTVINKEKIEKSITYKINRPDYLVLSQTMFLKAIRGFISVSPDENCQLYWSFSTWSNMKTSGVTHNSIICDRTIKRIKPP